MLTCRRASTALRNDTWFALTLAVVFCTLASLGLLHHELWRDEWQAWLIARESHSLGDLFLRIRDEGHAPLWLLVLHLVARVTGSPAGMQVLNALIATATVYLFARYAPFPKWQRLLFSLGYFPLYEYGVISRDYGLALFFTVLLCAVFRPRRLLLVALAVVGLSASAVHALLIAIPMFAAAVWLHVRSWGTPRRLRSLAPGLAVAAVGLCAWGMFMTPGTRLDPLWASRAAFDPARSVRATSSVWNAYVPILSVAEDPHWNTNVLQTYNLWERTCQHPGLSDRDPLQRHEWLAFGLSVLLLLLAAACLADDRLLLLTFAASTLLLLLFFYFVHFGWLRHHGFLYVAFIACLWVSTTVRPTAGRSLLLRAARTSFLTCLLLAQAAGGILAYVIDWQRPFSSSPDAARFITTRHLSGRPIAGTPDFIVSPVAAILGTRFWSLDTGQYTASIMWTRPRTDSVANAVKKIARLVRRPAFRDSLLVFDYPYFRHPPDPRGSAKPRGFQVTPIGIFPPGMVPDEKYVIYYLQKRGANLPPGIAYLAIGQTIRY